MTASGSKPTEKYGLIGQRSPDFKAVGNGSRMMV